MVGARKKRRTQMIIIGGVALAASAALAGWAFNDAIVFFVPPTELVAKAAAGEIAPDRPLRLGGLVEMGSVKNAGAAVEFNVADAGASVPVRFDGVLPDLFREEQGVVVEGRYADGVFTATEVLAKHDENYMPKEVADSLKKQGVWKPEE